MSYLKEFTKGLVKENPTLVTLLGMCPTLAITTMASNAIGMGAAATFVLICSNVAISLLKKFIPKQVRLPLITVNCIILGRAEMFASKNNVAASALDGAGMGIGFTLALLAVGSIREILGSGTWFGLKIYPDIVQPMTIFVLPAGGFFVLGCVIAIVNKIANRKPPEATGCAACPNRESCISIEKTAETAEKQEKEENK